MKSKIVVKKDSYTANLKIKTTSDKLKTLTLAATSVWVLAAFANLGFVFGKIPSNKEIANFRNSEAVEQYRQEQIADLDQLYNEGQIDEAGYNKGKNDITKKSKAEIADVIYENNADYQAALKTNTSLSICSIVANSLVIGSALTYLGATIKQSKLRKEESEQLRRDLDKLLEEMQKDIERERARIEELKKAESDDIYNDFD